MLSEIQSELQAIQRMLTDNLHHLTWCHPIGLIIPWMPNLNSESDASYEGLGGRLHELDAMWWITTDDLCSLGWIIYGDPTELDLPLQDRPFAGYSINEEGMHINLLEFIALFINIWITIKRLHQLHPQGTADLFIAKFLADNTSAISWLKYAGRSNKMPIQNLAHLLTAMLLFFSHHSNIQMQVIGEYLEGKLNIVTDALLHFSKHPSWVSIIADESLNLQNVTAYHLPPQLLMILW